MQPPCHGKVLYATREFAEEIMLAQRARLGHHPAKAATHNVFYCAYHGGFHTGHQRFPGRSSRTTSTQESLGRLHSLRTTLVELYGQTKDTEHWRGVRALTGAIRHLQRSNGLPIA